MQIQINVTSYSHPILNVKNRVGTKILVKGKTVIKLQKYTETSKTTPTSQQNMEALPE